MLVRLTSKDPSSLRRPFVWSCLQMNIHKSSFHTWRVVWGKSRLDWRLLEPPYYYFPTFRYTAMQCLFSLVSLLRTGWYICVFVLCAQASHIATCQPAAQAIQLYIHKCDILPLDTRQFSEWGGRKSGWIQKWERGCTFNSLCSSLQRSIFVQRFSN